ncbi:uncharacterized protein LOC111272478 isoform X3 [Varroa jacobsoni]|nr:uncharacterized protein LOC111272478 isoform X3 [Varroa jacobsoni]
MNAEQFFLQLSPLFPKLSFAETECISTENHLGQCVGYPECKGPSLIREGRCSDGFGVCCFYLRSITNKNKQNLLFADVSSTDKSRTFIKSPSKRAHPPTDLGEMEYIDIDLPTNALGVNFANPDYPLRTKQPYWSSDVMIPREVCQVRLDFEQLDLPLTTVFKVKLNGVVVAPPLTGNNSGQHLIVNVVTAITRPARLELSVSGAPVPTSWSVWLQHNYCFSPALAPEGCMQYNSMLSGRVRSLSVLSTEPTLYAVCLRAPKPTANLISLRTLPDKTIKSCSSFMQVPAGMSLDGKEIPTKVCPRDAVRLTYKVFGPLVLYMMTSSGQHGIDVQYNL